jgi:hypothetical protein
MHPNQILTRKNVRHARRTVRVCRVGLRPRPPSGALVAKASGEHHSKTVDVIPADSRLLAALTTDNDEGHIYSAGAEHSESGECVKGRHAMRAEHDVPGFLGERSSHPRSESATRRQRTHRPTSFSSCAHDELGSGIRALDDQHRELTVDDHPRTTGHAQITATRGDATGRLPFRARFPDPCIEYRRAARVAQSSEMRIFMSGNQ